MSGIFAIVHLDGQPIDPRLLQQLTETLKYLGRDHQQIWHQGHVGLGHTLFRTTYEAANEQQPCTLDGKVYIIADGRIDGRDELITLLQGKSRSVNYDVPDVELILHAYQVGGKDCLQYLLGDFAFILWDENQKRLFCARDRLGLRRLYYAQVGNALVLCNSLDCLRGYPGVTAKLNEQAVGDFLLFGSHTWLDKSTTIFADIQKVPPAHCLSWEGQNLDVKRYWDIPLEVPLLRYKREEDYIAHFREIFTTAVRDRMRTDKIVIAMSGGLDSSSIAATACRIADEMSKPPQIQAFTAVYDRIHPDRERYYAGLVAEKLGLLIHYFPCDDYQLLTPTVRTPEPVQSYTPAMQVDLWRQVSLLGRVLLTGDTGDNLLFCSPIMKVLGQMNPIWLLWQLLKLRQRFGSMPPLGTGILAAFKGKGGKEKMSYPYPNWLNPEFEARLHLPERWQFWPSWQPPSLNRRHPEIHKWLVFPDWSIGTEQTTAIDFTPAEWRDPFADIRLIEFVLSLPLLPWLFKKYLLRRSMEEDLPAEVVQRPKTPLGAVYNSLLGQEGVDWIDNWLPVPELLNYVSREKIPPLAGGTLDMAESFVHLRPAILNLWLQCL